MKKFYRVELPLLILLGAASMVAIDAGATMSSSQGGQRPGLGSWSAGHFPGIASQPGFRYAIEGSSIFSNNRLNVSPQMPYQPNWNPFGQGPGLFGYSDNNGRGGGVVGGAPGGCCSPVD